MREARDPLHKLPVKHVTSTNLVFTSSIFCSDVEKSLFSLPLLSSENILFSDILVLRIIRIPVIIFFLNSEIGFYSTYGNKNRSGVGCAKLLFRVFPRG